MHQALSSVNFIIFLSILLFSFQKQCWVEVLRLQRWLPYSRSRNYDTCGYFHSVLVPYNATAVGSSRTYRRPPLVFSTMSKISVDSVFTLLCITFPSPPFIPPRLPGRLSCRRVWWEGRVKKGVPQILVRAF